MSIRFDKSVFNSLGINEFLENEYILYSEPGKYRRSQALRFFYNGEEKLIKKFWKEQKAFLEFLSKNTKDIPKIKEALKNIPEIKSIITKDFMEAFEIFEIKKFIKNLRIIKKIYSKAEKKHILFKNNYNKLWELLNKDQSDDIFAVSNSYSKKLSSIRLNIKTLQEKINSLKREFLSSLAEEFGFSKRIYSDEFTLFEKSENLNRICSSDIFTLIEKKNGFFKFRINYPSEIIQYFSKIDKLLLDHKKEENKVLKRLSIKISEYKEKILQDFEKLIKWERLFSLAYMYLNFNMKQPSISIKSIKIRNGRYIPLEKFLMNNNMDYVPIDIIINHHSNLITGSNMGGKTQALKCIGFLQALFQLGMFVPADSFSSYLFDDIHFCSSEEFEQSKGLSSFGAEIDFLIKNMNRKKRALFLIDEFSRTTNIHEGIALNKALFMTFLDLPSTLILTGHFKLNLKKGGFFKVGGLKKDIKSLPNSSYNMEERLKLLHSKMDYRLYMDKSNEITEEALRVAEIMGFDQDIIELARSLM